MLLMFTALLSGGVMRNWLVNGDEKVN